MPTKTPKVLMPLGVLFLIKTVFLYSVSVTQLEERSFIF